MAFDWKPTVMLDCWSAAQFLRQKSKLHQRNNSKFRMIQRWWPLDFVSLFFFQSLFVRWLHNLQIETKNSKKCFPKQNKLQKSDFADDWSCITSCCTKDCTKRSKSFNEKIEFLKGGLNVLLFPMNVVSVVGHEITAFSSALSFGTEQTASETSFLKLAQLHFFSSFSWFLKKLKFFEFFTSMTHAEQKNVLKFEDSTPLFHNFMLICEMKSAQW